MRKNSSSNNLREKCRLAMMKFFQSQPSRLFTEREVIKACLSADESLNKLSLARTLGELLEAEYVVLSKNTGKYKLNKKNIVQGTLLQNHKGKLVIGLVGDVSTYYHVHPQFVGNAVPGDYVRAVFMPERIFNPKQVQVLQMIRRSEEEHLGVLHIMEAGRFVRVFCMSIPTDVYIPPRYSSTAEDGQLVYVRILSWAKKDKCPTGVIVDVVPDNEDKRVVRSLKIAAQYGIRTRFSSNVIRESQLRTDGVLQSDLSERLDFRNAPMVTIDPDGAKDFDDALSIQKMESGLWKVGIHIADVSHYVQEGSLMDQEARRRTRSSYFSGLVIPMLPEHLSNGLCSLMPNEDRLCFSVLLTMNDDAEIVDYQIAKTVIRSKRRYTYEECDLLLTGEADDEYASDLRRLLHFARKLKVKRLSNGCLDYDMEETSYLFDDQGNPNGLTHTTTTDSHLLVEEFMLCANRTVAEYVATKGVGRPFLYRSESAVTEASKRSLLYKLHAMGVHFKSDNPYKLEDSDVGGRSKIVRDYVIKTVTQSLPKAYYTSQSTSHFSLAFDFYCHFTSPIRRYSDVVVHRILASVLRNEDSVSADELDAIALDCSKVESVVSFAEKEEETLLSLEYLATRIGCSYKCLVTELQQDLMRVEIGALHKSAIVKRNTLRKFDYFYNSKRSRYENRKKTKSYLFVGVELRLDIMSVDARKNRVFMTFREKKQKTEPETEVQ